MTAIIHRTAASLREVAKRVPDVAWDGLGFGGAGCVVYGAWLIYKPSGWILGGVFAIAFAVLFAPTRKKGAPE